MGGHSQCFGEDFEYQKPFSCKIQGFEMLRLSFIQNYHMEFIVFFKLYTFLFQAFHLLLKSILRGHLLLKSTLRGLRCLMQLSIPT